LYYFRGHPEWCADEGVALRLDIRELSCHTEVCKLDFPGLGEEDIGGLDISMDLAFLVQVVETKQ
jgi:hypothetical protein